MKRIDPIVLGIIGLIVLVVVGIVLAANFSGDQPVVQYQTTDQDRPQAEISETNFDFGNTLLTDIKVKDLNLKNIGKQPLVLSNIFTSCNCTFAQVIIAGQVSPKFSMHKNPSWRGELPAGQSAVLRISYEPSLMPVKGRVNRSILVQTNDPQKPTLNINFTANVQ